MTLLEYVEAELERRQKAAPKGTVLFKTDLLKEIAKKSGVSLLTLQNITRGGKLMQEAKAQALSKATGGKVTTKDLLCT